MHNQSGRVESSSGMCERIQRKEISPYATSLSIVSVLESISPPAYPHVLAQEPRSSATALLLQVPRYSSSPGLLTTLQRSMGRWRMAKPCSKLSLPANQEQHCHLGLFLRSTLTSPQRTRTYRQYHWKDYKCCLGCTARICAATQ